MKTHSSKKFEFGTVNSLAGPRGEHLYMIEDTYEAVGRLHIGDIVLFIRDDEKTYQYAITRVGIGLFNKHFIHESRSEDDFCRRRL